MNLSDLFTPFPRDDSLTAYITFDNGRRMYGLTNFSKEEFRHRREGIMTEEGCIVKIVFSDEVDYDDLA